MYIDRAEQGEMICAFTPNCPHGNACAFQHPSSSKPIVKSRSAPDRGPASMVTRTAGEDDDSQTLVTTPSSTNSLFKSRSSAAVDELLDWGDGDDEREGDRPRNVRSLSVAKGIRVARSTPSSPLTQHFRLSDEVSLAVSMVMRTITWIAWISL